MKRSNNFTAFFRRNGKSILITILSIIIAAGIYFTIDYFGPNMIRLKPDTAFGFSCMRAKELIVQEYDKKGDLWASRGMIIYKLQKGDDKFIKVAHVPTDFTIFWLRNFTLLRRLTMRPECIEMVITGTGDICALSAGKLWHLPAGERKFHETLHLSHYGFGDQGVRNDGIMSINDSTIYFGEYFQNPSRTEVCIIETTDGGKTWHWIYKFKPGQIRHIHALQHDSYTGKNWICVGDEDEESMVAWSDDNFRTFSPIGQGSQLWRVCQLVFTEEDILWGTDNSQADLAGIYKYSRETKELSELIKVDGAVFFGTRLSKGTIVFSTDREGFRTEQDDKTRIFIITPDNQIKSIKAGTWKSKKPGFRFKFAMLRFQRDQGAPSLAITCLNQKEFPDGDLLIILEDTLINVTK
jgi:hypothetical protein